MKSSKVKFNADKLSKQIFANLVEEQTNRLIAYAEEMIKQIGDTIKTYHSRNHMDRTGNLLNSLCWGVAYDNELKASGFYREADSLELSFLHERDWDYMAHPVDGHALAEQYIRQYGRLGSGGGTWRVWFAILAPYWGYWERGFTMVSGGGGSPFPRSRQRLQFAVMAQFYDKLGADLKPAKTSIKVHVETYTSTTRSRDYKHRVDNPYSHFNKKWGSDSRYTHNKGRFNKLNK